MKNFSRGWTEIGAAVLILLVLVVLNCFQQPVVKATVISQGVVTNKLDGGEERVLAIRLEDGNVGEVDMTFPTKSNVVRTFKYKDKILVHKIAKNKYDLMPSPKNK